MSHPKLAVRNSGFGGRGYWIPGRYDGENANGSPRKLVYPSVTTVLKAVHKPGLIQWVADQTAAFAVANIGYLVQQSEEIGWGYLRFFWSRKPDMTEDELRDSPDEPGQKLRLHHAGVRDQAAELGTNVHEWMEADLDGTVGYPALDSIEAEQMAEQWDVFLQTHTIVSLGSEFTVVDDELGIAGTADADWKIRCDHDDPCLNQLPGEFVRTIIDIKTGRNLWPEHGMQLAALMTAPIRMIEVPQGFPGAQLHDKTEGGKKVGTWWIEEEQPEFDRAAILHIRPADLDSKGEKIAAFCRLEDLTEDIDLDKQSFVGALIITRNSQEKKLRQKARALAEKEAA